MSQWCNFYVCSGSELERAYKAEYRVPQLVSVVTEAEVPEVLHGGPDDEWVLEAFTRHLAARTGRRDLVFDLSRATKIGGNADPTDVDDYLAFFVLPSEWVAAVAMSPPESLPELVASVSEELVLDTPDVVQWLLTCMQELVALCGSARRLGKDVVYSWTL